MMRDSMPTGFRKNSTGLIVPEDISRKREVWTKSEWRILERATKLLKSRDIQIFLRCDQKDCQKEPMERLRRPDGGITLRCQHKDREIHAL